MEPLSLFLIGFLSIFVGILIGGIGIGGILLVPMLTLIFGMGVHEAIGSAMFSYIFSGLVGAVLYARERSIRWSMAFWLFVGAIPAAFSGAFLSSVIPSWGLELFIALLIIFAGGNACSKNFIKGGEGCNVRWCSNTSGHFCWSPGGTKSSVRKTARKRCPPRARRPPQRCIASHAGVEA